MAQILHGRARTTEEIRSNIQNSKKSITALAQQYGINYKTAAKWKQRDYVHDTPMGPKNPKSTVLNQVEEAAILAFRKKTLLPLDERLYTLQELIPHPTPSSLHRCLKPHGISRLPQEEKNMKKTKKFKKYPAGYIHIDIAQVRTQEGKLFLFVAIDRVNKFVYAKLFEKQTKLTATEFLKEVITTIPYKIQIILTDNGSQFTTRKQDKYAVKHPFDRICEKNNIQHRLTKPNHPWTNGQVERMNRTIKEVSVKQYHYKTHEELKNHLVHFLNFYNFAKRLKALKGRTPYEEVIYYWKSQPEIFKKRPDHYTMGLYN